MTAADHDGSGETHVGTRSLSPTPEEREAFCQTIIHEWGGPSASTIVPSRALDPSSGVVAEGPLRMGASPGVPELTRMNAEDIRNILLTIACRRFRCIAWRSRPEDRGRRSHFIPAELLELPMTITCHSWGSGAILTAINRSCTAAELLTTQTSPQPPRR
jgi:hypothetical protein